MAPAEENMDDVEANKDPKPQEQNQVLKKVKDLIQMLQQKLSGTAEWLQQKLSGTDECGLWQNPGPIQPTWCRIISTIFAMIVFLVVLYHLMFLFLKHVDIKRDRKLLNPVHKAYLQKMNKIMSNITNDIGACGPTEVRTGDKSCLSVQQEWSKLVTIVNRFMTHCQVENQRTAKNILEAAHEGRMQWTTLGACSKTTCNQDVVKVLLAGLHENCKLIAKNLGELIQDHRASSLALRAEAANSYITLVVDHGASSNSLNADEDNSSITLLVSLGCPLMMALVVFIWQLRGHDTAKQLRGQKHTAKRQPLLM